MAKLNKKTWIRKRPRKDRISQVETMHNAVKEMRRGPAPEHIKELQQSNIISSMQLMYMNSANIELAALRAQHPEGLVYTSFGLITKEELDKKYKELHGEERPATP